MVKAINASIATGPSIDLLVSFMEDDAITDTTQVKKMIYPPDPYIRIFLDKDLTPI